MEKASKWRAFRVFLLVSICFSLFFSTLNWNKFLKREKEPATSMKEKKELLFAKRTMIDLEEQRTERREQSDVGQWNLIFSSV